MKSGGDNISCHVKTALAEHAMFCHFYLIRCRERRRMDDFMTVYSHSAASESQAVVASFVRAPNLAIVSGGKLTLTRFCFAFICADLLGFKCLGF